MKRFITSAIIAITAAFLVGCGATTNAFVSKENASTSYKSAQRLTRVKLATVVQVRNVRIAKSAALGQRAGASAGAVMGYALARKLSSKRLAQATFAGLAGAIGAELGKQGFNSSPGQEIVVEMDNDKRVYAVAQASTDGVIFRAGQKVMVIGNGRIAPLQ